MRKPARYMLKACRHPEYAVRLEASGRDRCSNNVCYSLLLISMCVC